MANKLDDLLNKMTIYRLVLYYLVLLFSAALVLGALGILHYSPFVLLSSALITVLACWATNTIFSSVFEAKSKIESTLITALILALIISPLSSLGDLTGFSFLVWASILAIASKYILAFDKKHIFNPAAFAVALTSITLNLSANWWVGSLPMLPFVIIGGLPVLRKIRGFDLVSSFIIAAILSTTAFAILEGTDALGATWRGLLYSCLLFFAFVMITDPATTPPGKSKKVVYGLLVGLLFAPQLSILGVYFTPELALLVGNVFSYLAGPKGKRVMEAVRKQLSPSEEKAVPGNTPEGKQGN